ncbi:hypothetical protein IW261DRAFT_377685 [Armillaria novae-zelandiae]|uniref:PQ-loop repeat-containing protein 1 n=1 Tax=Armillaria novae-zelandiae TaxID=153914 RepID=A0AA39PQV9_9AGAR|nr:hypothetical protein IW261DRAFT_377685 [Armillaria novae-zelandiae]
MIGNFGCQACAAGLSRREEYKKTEGRRRRSVRRRGKRLASWRTERSLASKRIHKISTLTATSMSPSWLSTAASIGMAVGPPLVYADQAASIIRKRDATGFSRDVCAILLLANITRCFFWLGNHFELALLIQSVLMILAQLALLYICIRYRPTTSPENFGTSTRPFSFWQWSTYTQYIEFLAGFILLEAILFLILGRSKVFVSLLGFVALGLESTLPIPQLISNFKQRSLYGFRRQRNINMPRIS